MKSCNPLFISSAIFVAYLDEILLVLVKHEVVVDHVARGDPIQQLQIIIVNKQVEMLRQLCQSLVL